MDAEFKQKIEEYLSALPSKWVEQLTILLCEIKEDTESVDCAKVKQCETLTSLSDFTLSGTEASIKYTNEAGVQVTRTVDVGTLLNGTLDDLDPNCLASSEAWNSMSYTERIQALIDSHCDCCSTTTTTTTTSTTTTTTTP